jgi:hypothetical protein
MARKPWPPKPIRWIIYKIASKAVWLGEGKGVAQMRLEPEFSAVIDTRRDRQPIKPPRTRAIVHPPSLGLAGEL